MTEEELIGLVQATGEHARDTTDVLAELTAFVLKLSRRVEALEDQLEALHPPE